MRPCPGCQYIVPGGWEQCKRCGADLTPVAAMAAQPAGVLASVAARPAAPSAYLPPPPPARPSAPAPVAPSRPMPVATFHSAPPMVVADLRPAGAAAGATHGKRRRRRSPIGALVAVIVIGACGYLGWDKLAHPPIPAELKPWIDKGQGVTYAPSGAGLSVSLPARPAEMSGQLGVGGGVQVGDRFSEATVGVHVVGVAWFSVPSAALANDPDGPVHVAADMASRVASFTLDVSEPASYHGLPAIDAEMHRGTAQGDAFVVLDGTRVVVVYVLGADHGTAGYDHLRHSLQLT